MQQGRVSTIRFNEWICVCAQYEKAVARIGRQIYQGYSRGLIDDYAAIQMCKDISQAFVDSKALRADLEEELERDALRGLSVEEAKQAEQLMELTPVQKATRFVKLKLTKLAGRAAVNRSLQSYRTKVIELSRDLGLRALAVHTKQPLLKMDGHMRLCRLAVKLDEESNRKWEDIVRGNTGEGGGGGGGLNLSFHTILISFVASLANFSRGTKMGKVVQKVMKYDPREEEKKLTAQFEGSQAGVAQALEAQLAEIDEPDLDIGREMAEMEREYEETPTEWGLPPRAEDNWVPDTAGTWAPKVEAEPLSAAPPSTEKSKPTPSVGAPKPQVLRQRPQPEPLKGAEAWVAAEPEDWVPPAPAGPRITAKAQVSEPVDDWATETPPEEDFFPTAPDGPRIGNVPSAPPQEVRTPAPAPLRPPGTGGFPSEPPASSPAASINTPAQPALPPLPPLPPLPARPIRSLDIPAAAPAPRSPAPTPAPAASADPLLRLLRTDAAAEAKSDDELLPAFLRERNDDDSLDSSSYIPDLPDSVDSGLKIIPFGGAQDKKTDDESDSFIPKMPE